MQHCPPAPPSDLDIERTSNLAELIRDTHAVTDGVVREDLLAQGVSARRIDRLGAAAVELVGRRATRVIQLGAA